MFEYKFSQRAVGEWPQRRLDAISGPLLTELPARYKSKLERSLGPAGAPSGCRVLVLQIGPYCLLYSGKIKIVIILSIIVTLQSLSRGKVLCTSMFLTFMSLPIPFNDVQ